MDLLWKTDMKTLSMFWQENLNTILWMLFLSLLLLSFLKIFCFDLKSPPAAQSFASIKHQDRIKHVAPWCGCRGCPGQTRPWWPQSKPRLCTATGRSTACTPPPPGAAGWAARSTPRRCWSPGCGSSRTPAATAPLWTETHKHTELT